MHLISLLPDSTSSDLSERSNADSSSGDRYRSTSSKHMREIVDRAGEVAVACTPTHKLQVTKYMQ